MFITAQGPALFQIQDQKKRPRANLIIGSFLDKKNDLAILAKSKTTFDMVLVSQNKLVPSGFTKLKGDPFLVNTPGEFEIKGAEIQGVQNGANIVYIFSLDSIKAAFISKIDKKELASNLTSAVEGIDILFIPLQGKETTLKDITKVITQVEPKMVIPIDFTASILKEFFAIVGVEPVEPVPSLDIKSANLSAENLAVEVLTP